MWLIRSPELTNPFKCTKEISHGSHMCLTTMQPAEHTFYHIPLYFCRYRSSQASFYLCFFAWRHDKAAHMETDKI